VSDPPYNPYVGIDVCEARLDVAGKRKKLALIACAQAARDPGMVLTFCAPWRSLHLLDP
jgi:hypothetical protein